MGIYHQTRSYLMFCVCSVSLCGGSLVLKAKSVEFLYLSMDQSSFECAVQQCSLYLSVMGIGESWGYKAITASFQQKGSHTTSQGVQGNHEPADLYSSVWQGWGCSHLAASLPEETTQGSEDKDITISVMPKTCSALFIFILIPLPKGKQLFGMKTEYALQQNSRFKKKICWPGTKK